MQLMKFESVETANALRKQLAMWSSP